MEILADVARNPAFAQEELERQRAQALDGLSVAYQSPGALAGYATSPVIFAGTAFGHVPSGTPASLKKLATTDLAKLHQAYFRPDNAILVMTGDITPEQGFALAEKTLGDWKAPAAAAPPRGQVTPTAPPPRRRHRPARHGPGGRHHRQGRHPPQRSAVLPRPSSPTRCSAAATRRASTRRFRIKRGLSYGANSRLAAMRTTGLFRAVAQTKNESAPQVLDLIMAELQRLGAAPPTADELKARKSVLIGGFGRELATTDGLAGIIGNLALYDLPLDEIAAYTGKVEAVTAGQIQDFAARNLAPRRRQRHRRRRRQGLQGRPQATPPNLEVVPRHEAEPGLRDPRLKASHGGRGSHRPSPGVRRRHDILCPAAPRPSRRARGGRDRSLPDPPRALRRPQLRRPTGARWAATTAIRRSSSPSRPTP
jgi:zinc protease